MTADRDDHPYAERLRRVASFIDAHIDEPLPLERLAEVACFSPYHFHRIYRWATGETADQTVRRVRLHRAAVALIVGEEPLAAIAKAAGYGSTEAFSRAFSAAYGRPPSAYRGEPAAPALERKMIAMTLTVTIEDAPPRMLQGLHHHGDYMKISSAFERLATRLAPAGPTIPAGPMIGVYFHDPSATPEPDLRAFAGVVIDAAGPED